MASDETTRKRHLAQALFECKRGEIGVCDACDCPVLREHLHTHHGSMMKEWSVCPDCDLPEKWHAKFSKRQGKRYFVYFDPHVGSGRRFVQWGHPTEGNPLHNPHEQGEYATKKKRMA